MSTFNSKVWSIAVAALLVVMCSSASAGTTVLDNFQGTTQQNLLESDTVGTMSDSFSNGGDPSSIILGDERNVRFTQTVASGLGRVVVNEETVGGVYELSFPKNAVGYSTIQYDGPDGSMDLDPVGLGGVDFTQGGTHSLLNVAIPFSDHATELIVTVYSGADSASEYTVPVEVVQMGETTLEETAFFSDFQKKDGVANPVDFMNVGAMEIRVNGDIPGGALDVQISSIGTASVPEPGSVMSLLLGAVCLLGFRMYRSRRGR